MGVVVDKNKAPRLINTVKQRVPVKHRQHETGQGIGQEHLARSDHIGTLIDGGHDAHYARRPGFQYQKHQANSGPGDPGQQDHAVGLNGLFDLQRGKGHMVDKQDQKQRHRLDVKRAKRCRENRHHCIHWCVLHHRAGRAFGAGNGTNGFGMGQEQKDTRHHIEQEIAPNSRPAHPQHREHKVEDSDKHHRLHNIHSQSDERIIVF